MDTDPGGTDLSERQCYYGVSPPGEAAWVADQHRRLAASSSSAGPSGTQHNALKRARDSGDTAADVDMETADVHDAAELGSDYAGREIPLAVMFTDIKGFTPFAESNLAYDVVHALNRYFDVVGKAVDVRGGYIDKYIGDGVMVLFGLDRGRSTHPCIDAVEAAFDALDRMRPVNAYLQTHLDRTFQVAIGIHYGHAVVGEVGYKLKRQFTAIGDVVNTAARLEEEAKRHGVGLLVTDEVLRELPPEMCRIGKTVELSLRGKTGQTTAYSIAARTLD